MSKLVDLKDKCTLSLQSQGPALLNNAEKEEKQVNF